MTPSALTPAARRAGTQTPAAARPKARPTARPKRAPVKAPGSAPSSSGHRSQLRRGPAPRTARRVSGPLRGIARARATVTPNVPAAPRRARRPGAPAIGAPRVWAARLARFVRSLPEHSLLDGLIRGRWWIPLLGVLLAGIVFMQVEVLKLNATNAAALQHSTALQNERDQLQASVARLADEQRIESLAAHMGMVMPQPAQVKFLSPGPSTVGAALGNIHQPDATTFTANLPSTQLDPLTAGVLASTGSSATASATGAPATSAPATSAPTTSAPTTSATTTAAAAPTSSTPAAATSTAPAGG